MLSWEEEDVRPDMKNQHWSILVYGGDDGDGGMSGSPCLLAHFYAVIEH